jgi:hypothetical protein
MMYKNAINVTPGQPLVQEFTWQTQGGPIQLEEAQIAVRWWKDGKPSFSSTTECGEVFATGPGAFDLRLSGERASLAAECDVYDAFAFLPEHGLSRITRGPVQIAPTSDEDAIPRQGA